LKSKPGQESKTKYRGEIEVRVAFTVKSGSLLDLSKKEKLRGSFGQLGQAAQSFGKWVIDLLLPYGKSMNCFSAWISLLNGLCYVCGMLPVTVSSVSCTLNVFRWKSVEFGRKR
jgi:hypothetical protein